MKTHLPTSNHPVPFHPQFIALDMSLQDRAGSKLCRAAVFPCKSSGGSTSTPLSVFWRNLNFIDPVSHSAFSVFLQRSTFLFWTRSVNASNAWRYAICQMPTAWVDAKNPRVDGKAANKRHSDVFPRSDSSFQMFCRARFRWSSQIWFQAKPLYSTQRYCWVQ